MGLKTWRQKRRYKRLLKDLKNLPARDVLAAHYESQTGVDPRTFYELVVCKRVRGNIFENFISVYSHMLNFSQKDIEINFNHDQRYSSYENYE